MCSNTLSISGAAFLLHMVLLGLLGASLADGKVVQFLPQSFFFDWNPDGQVPPIPVTEQCQAIHVKWARSAATGPNNAAPYYLQVYSSSYITPFIISAGDNLSLDWQVPFAPGTQYQICMFDKNGNTGGCQATYTMIHSSTNATCANVTAPPALDTEGFVINGPWSQYGWIDQCTDLSIIPKNGTPPYTLTIAPALHPPYNITSNDNSPLNWTVSLSWATPFFVSVVDGTGQLWSSGPLHSGGGQYSTTGCLSGQINKRSSIKPYVAIASGGGGLVLGLLVGALTVWFFLKKSKTKQIDTAHPLRDSSNSEGVMIRPGHLPGHEQYVPIPTASSGLSNSLSRGGLGYHVEPFTMPDEEGRNRGAVPSQSHGSGYTASSGPHQLAYDREELSPPPQNNPLQPSQSTSTSTSNPTRRPNQVYVVHHDSQTPPVTIYHQDGTQIVELPPRYPQDLSPLRNSDDLPTSDGRSSGSEVRSETSRSTPQNALMLHQVRQAAPIRKLPQPGSPKS